MLMSAPHWRKTPGLFRRCPAHHAVARLCATVFARQDRPRRHLVVAPNGVVYVTTGAATYYQHDKPQAGGFLSRSRHEGTGHADV